MTKMNEMVEKVALAIGGLANDYCNPCTDEKIIKCKECHDTAKSAIKVMRELYETDSRKFFKDFSDAVKE
jgi:hypothetical protein